MTATQHLRDFIAVKSQSESESQTQSKSQSQRRRVHGGSDGIAPQYVAVIETSDDSRLTVPRIRNKWRATFIGILMGLLLVLMLLMKWLLELQVAAAAERHAQETAARSAMALCFELASPAAVAACRNALESAPDVMPPAALGAAR